MNNRRTTTTKNGFKVEDITFKGARKQSEILNELDEENDGVEESVLVPVSLTPEQVKVFYECKIEVTKNPREKKVYEQTIRWIDEMLTTRKRLLAYEAKEVAEVSDDEGSTEI